MDDRRPLPMNSAPFDNRPSATSEQNKNPSGPAHHGVPDSLLDPVARRLSAQLCSVGGIASDRSPCLSATAPAGQVVGWEAAGGALGSLPAGAPSSHGFLGGGPGGNTTRSSNLLLVPNGDLRMHHGDPEFLADSVGSRGATSEESSFIRTPRSIQVGAHGQAPQLPVGLSGQLGSFGLLPDLTAGMPEVKLGGVDHLLWDGRAPQRLRRTSALDVQAPPGYESVDLGVTSAYSKPPPAPDQDAPLTHDYPLPARGGGARDFGEQQQLTGQQEHLGEYFRRRSSTLSPPTQPVRAKGWGRRARGRSGAVASTPSSADSAASAPVRFLPDAIGNGFITQMEEGARGELLTAEGGGAAPPHSSKQAYEEVAAFVRLLYDTIMDTNSSVQSSSSRLPTDLSDIVAALYSPTCTHKQLLDPQLVGGITHDQPVFDEGTGHADVVRQFTILRSCIKGFSLTVERMQTCVAAAGRLSCALRGTVVSQRTPVQGGTREGRDGGAPRGVDFGAPAKMGRFAHFLTLMRKPPDAEAAAGEAGVEGGGRAPGSSRWCPLVRGGISFVVESEVFVLLTAAQEGTTALASPRVLNEHAFISDADRTSGALNGFSAASSLGRRGSLGIVGPLCGGMAPPHANRDAFSGLSAMLKSAISLGQDNNSVSGPTGNGDSASGELPSAADCMQEAVAKLATSLLADAAVSNSHNALGTTRWSSIMHDPAQRQRRSRKKKKSRQRCSDRQEEHQLCASNDLAGVECQLGRPSLLQLRMQMHQLDQHPQERLDDLPISSCLQADGLLAAPGFQCISQDAFDRTVFVSWIPRAARAQALSEKEAAEQKLKRVLTEELGICGIERVLVFPPRGSHCCIAFRNSQASMAFLMEYAGGTFTPNTEKFKRRICASFNVEFDRGIQRVFVRIEGVRMMPQAVRVADPENSA